MRLKKQRWKFVSSDEGPNWISSDAVIRPDLQNEWLFFFRKEVMHAKAKDVYGFEGGCWLYLLELITGSSKSSLYKGFDHLLCFINFGIARCCRRY